MMQIIISILKKTSNNSKIDLYYGIAFTLKGDTEAKKRSAEDDEFVFTFSPKMIDMHTCLKNDGEPKALITQNSHIIKDKKIYLSDMNSKIEDIYDVDGIQGRTFKSKDFGNSLKAFYQRVTLSHKIPAHSSYTLRYAIHSNSIFSRADHLSVYGTHISNNISIFKLPRNEKDPDWIPAVGYELGDDDAWEKASDEQKLKRFDERKKQHLLFTKTHREYQPPTHWKNFLVALDVFLAAATIVDIVGSVRYELLDKALEEIAADAAAKLEAKNATQETLIALQNEAKNYLKLWQYKGTLEEFVKDNRWNKYAAKLLGRIEKAKIRFSEIKGDWALLTQMFECARLNNTLQNLQRFCIQSLAPCLFIDIFASKITEKYILHSSKIKNLVCAEDFELEKFDPKTFLSEVDDNNGYPFIEVIVNNTDEDKEFSIDFGIAYVHNYQRTREVSTKTSFKIPVSLQISNFKYNN